MGKVLVHLSQVRASCPKLACVSWVVYKIIGRSFLPINETTTYRLLADSGWHSSKGRVVSQHMPTLAACFKLRHFSYVTDKATLFPNFAVLGKYCHLTAQMLFACARVGCAGGARKVQSTHILIYKCKYKLNNRCNTTPLTYNALTFLIVIICFPISLS